MGFINENIKAARKEKGLRQDEVALKLGIPRSTYSRFETTSQKIDHDTIAAIAKVFGYKYADLINEDFIQKYRLNEPEAKYKKEKKELSEIKIVDSEVLLVQDTLQIKAMLRVLLRSQATLVASQRKTSVDLVLNEMTKAVRSETSEEFEKL